MGLLRSFGIVAVLVLGATLAVADDETPESFPEGPGREETFYFCAACHGGAIIKQQGLTRERWSDVFDVMTEKHGMPVLEGDERKQMLDYLTQAFPPRRRTPANPFLK